MRFFDFLYYKIYKFYSSKEKGAEVTSAGVVGFLQSINLLTLVMLFYAFFFKDAKIQAFVFIVPVIAFQVTTYIRYIYKEKHSIRIVEKKWLDMPGDYQDRFSIVQAIYIILSAVCFLGLAIYLGSRR